MTYKDERNKLQDTINEYLEWFKKNCNLKSHEMATLHILFSTSLHILDDFLEEK